MLLIDPLSRLRFCLWVASEELSNFLGSQSQYLLKKLCWLFPPSTQTQACAPLKCTCVHRPSNPQHTHIQTQVRVYTEACGHFGYRTRGAECLLLWVTKEMAWERVGKWELWSRQQPLQDILLGKQKRLCRGSLMPERGSWCWGSLPGRWLSSRILRGSWRKPLQVKNWKRP